MPDHLRLVHIDLHTRKLRYFLAVADELHFSRAAARLFLTQQGLSRQIRELEDELGVRLFTRTTRSVALTAAGAAFAAAVTTILDELDRSVEDLRRTNRALSGRLSLGFCPGAALELTLPIIDAFRQAFPDVDLEMREFPIADPSAGLNSGAVDIAFIRLPQRTEKIATEPLFSDPTIAVVAKSHAFAARESVAVSDLVNQTMTLSSTADEVYRDFWSLQSARDSGAVARFLPVSSVSEEEALVAAGAAVAVTSSAVPEYSHMPGVRYLEITDWPSSAVALGWHPGERSELVAGFVDTACAVRDREQDLIAMMEDRRPPSPTP